MLHAEFIVLNLCPLSATRSTLEVSIDPSVDEMAPLRDFLDCMAANMICSDKEGENMKNDFAILKNVANGKSSPPTEVHEAIETIKAENRPLLASFKGFPQGKKLMSLCEEAIEGRLHLQSVCHDLAQVKTDCEQFTTALSGNTVDSAVKNFTKVHSNFKAAKVKATQGLQKPDSAMQSALSSAESALMSFGKDISTHYCLTELGPWLLTQSKTLKSSRIMSKPPASSCMNLKPLMEKLLGEGAVATFVDIEMFHVSCSAIAEETDILLRQAGESSASRTREAVVRLCQSYKQWQERANAMVCTFPSVNDATNETSARLNELVSHWCSNIWNDAMGFPRNVLGHMVTMQANEIVTDGTRSLLKQALQAVSETKLLVTGLSGDDRESLAETATFLEHLFQYTERSFEDQSPASARHIFELFQDLQLISKDDCIRTNVGDFPEDQLQRLGIAW